MNIGMLDCCVGATGRRGLRSQPKSPKPARLDTPEDWSIGRRFADEGRILETMALKKGSQCCSLCKARLDWGTDGELKVAKFGEAYFCFCGEDCWTQWLPKFASKRTQSSRNDGGSGRGNESGSSSGRPTLAQGGGEFNTLTDTEDSRVEADKNKPKVAMKSKPTQHKSRTRRTKAGEAVL